MIQKFLKHHIIILITINHEICFELQTFLYASTILGNFLFNYIVYIIVTIKSL